MKYYSCFGFNDFVLCLGYKGDVIRNYFINYGMDNADMTITIGKSLPVVRHVKTDEDGWNVSLVETGLDSMTGARVRKIRKYIGDDENFMLTYGDGVGNVNIEALLQFHKEHGRIATVTGVHPPGRFGELEYDNQSGKVYGFNEKPQVTGGRINGGFFVFNKKVFDYLNDSDDLVLEQQPMKKLVSDDQLVVFKHDGFWQPMDTSREYGLLNDMVTNNKAPWILW
jgi:glucose-1-phosphate cytidylyltransferase